jgi:hypothetical protein
MKTASLLTTLTFIAGVGFASAGTIGIGVVTDDASTGIDGNIVYTHTVSGGGPATINGVTLEELSPAVTPGNFTWASSGGMNEINPINNNNWTPATGGVTGAGALDMFGGFTYAGGGANAGSTQSFTLSGLTPGVPHEMRLYIRPWDQGGSGRPIDLSFTGLVTDIASPAGGAPEDRPSLVLGAGSNDHFAYYVSYNYLPSASGELIIDANVPGTAPANSGSFHMYGLTNAVIPEPSSIALIGLGFLGLLRRRR